MLLLTSDTYLHNGLPHLCHGYILGAPVWIWEHNPRPWCHQPSNSVCPGRWDLIQYQNCQMLEGTVHLDINLT